MGWLSRLFFQEHRDGGNQDDSSKKQAYNRLKLVLMHDRTQISPAVMEKLRDELVVVISKYVEIDESALELNLETESDTIALVANIPVIRSKPQAMEPFSPENHETASEDAALIEVADPEVSLETFGVETPPKAVTEEEPTPSI